MKGAIFLNFLRFFSNIHLKFNYSHLNVQLKLHHNRSSIIEFLIYFINNTSQYERIISIVQRLTQGEKTTYSKYSRFKVT